MMWNCTGACFDSQIGRRSSKSSSVRGSGFRDLDVAKCYHAGVNMIWQLVKLIGSLVGPNILRF